MQHILYTLLGLWILGAAHASADEPAVYEVAELRETWFDESRQRQVPVRILYPQAITTPCPIVLISHGLGGSRDGLTYLGQALAERGYIAVHIQHAGSDRAVWQDVPAAERMQTMRRAMRNPDAATSRIEDVAFVLNTLAQRHEAEGELAGRLDMDRVGIAGHSFGAWTAMTQAGLRFGLNERRAQQGRDDRIQAVLAMSSPVPRESQQRWAYAHIAVPVMHMTGTRDESILNDTTAAERRIPFDRTPASAPDQYLIIFDGADHMVFGGTDRLRGPRNTLHPDETYEAAILSAAFPFFDRYLLDDESAGAFLQNGLPEALMELATFEHR